MPSSVLEDAVRFYVKNVGSITWICQRLAIADTVQGAGSLESGTRKQLLILYNPWPMANCVSSESQCK